MEQGLSDFHAEASPEPAVEDDRSETLKFFYDVIETLVLALVLFFGINFVSARIRVDGSSMVPTLQSDEFVFVNRLVYKFGSIERGDIVVFHYPGDPNQEYIKRVIGLPGDHIRVFSGNVYVNEQVIQEPYIAAAPLYQGEWQIPEDDVFVLGDNRNSSSDSHNWGPVPLENVIGKAVFVYWPPPNWGIVTSHNIANAAAYP
jgi:signal peptidase I